MALGDSRFGETRPPLAWLAGLAVVLAVLAAGALLVFGGRLGGLRGTADSGAGAVGGVLEAPVRAAHSSGNFIADYFFAASQNAELKQRLQAADRWRDDLIALREENARLKALLGVRTDPPLPMVFAHTVVDARGPFSNSRLADAGSDQGVAEGNPVVSESGLIGRVVGVAHRVSRVMLVTDVQSRTPVFVPRANGRAILTGDGGPNPVLGYLRTHIPLREGDRVLTSGDGGVIPRGLPVGSVVKGIDGSWRVALDADNAPMDEVRILLFRDFSQLAGPEDLAPKALPSLATEPPAPPPPSIETAPGKTGPGKSAPAKTATKAKP